MLSDGGGGGSVPVSPALLRSALWLLRQPESVPWVVIRRVYTGGWGGVHSVATGSSHTGNIIVAPTVAVFCGGIKNRANGEV